MTICVESLYHISKKPNSKPRKCVIERPADLKSTQPRLICSLISRLRRGLKVILVKVLDNFAPVDGLPCVGTRYNDVGSVGFGVSLAREVTKYTVNVEDDKDSEDEGIITVKVVNEKNKTGMLKRSYKRTTVTVI